MKHLIISLILILFFGGCKKQDEDPLSPIYTGMNLIEANITASIGGTLATENGLRLDIPAGALTGSGNVILGVTGVEETTVPNGQFQIINTPFTIKLPVSRINAPLTITFPVDAITSNINRYNLVLYDGFSYYPFEFTISNNIVTGTIDKIDWETSSDPSVPDKPNLIYRLVVYFLKDTKIHSTDQVGIRRVSMTNGLEFLTPDAPYGSKNLLLIHGWNSSPLAWEDMIPKLMNLGNSPYTQVWTFGYNSSQSISTNASNLLAELQNKCNGKKVDIIAHSMGGLVARQMMEKNGGAAFVDKLITLGTPHTGSQLAALRALVGVLVASEYLPGIVTYYYLTQGMKDLNPSSAFLSGLSTLSNPPVSYYTIAAKNNPAYWLLSNTSYLPGDDDGIVTVASATAVQNSTESIIIDINAAVAHCEMQSNQDVFDKIITCLLGSPQQFGAISGRVKDFATGSGVEGATVNLKQAGVTVSTTVTDYDGFYVFSNLVTGVYSLVVTKSGYPELSKTGLVVYANQNTTYDVSWYQFTGRISGQINDATTGIGILGVSVSLKSGGSIVSSTTSNSSGYYEFDDPSLGTYEVSVSKSGFIATSTTGITVTAYQTTTVNFSMSPVSSNIVYRFVLSWGSSPNDLDAHLLKGGFHIYFNNAGSLTVNPFAFLDIDCRDGYGPETITIAKLNSQSSKFYVHNYSGETDIKQSDAVVKIYSGNSLVKTYNVPTSGSGTYWYVCDISSSGTITTKNYLSTTPPAGAPDKVTKKLVHGNF